MNNGPISLKEKGRKPLGPETLSSTIDQRARLTSYADTI